MAQKERGEIELMDLTKGEIVHLAASLAEKGKVVTIVSAKHKLMLALALWGLQQVRLLQATLL